MSCDKVYVGVDMAVTLTGMKDADGNYLNAGTSGWVLYACTDTDLTPVNSGALTYVPASNGNYAGTVPGSTSIVVDQTYLLIVTFEQSGLLDQRNVSLTGAYRGKT